MSGIIVVTRQRVASQLTDPKHTLAGIGVRREKRTSVWNVKKRKKTRGGAFYKVMQNRGARASDAAPISRRRCVCFPKRNTRQPNNNFRTDMELVRARIDS